MILSIFLNLENVTFFFLANMNSFSLVPYRRAHRFSSVSLSPGSSAAQCFEFLVWQRYHLIHFTCSPQQTYMIRISGPSFFETLPGSATAPLSSVSSLSLSLFPHLFYFRFNHASREIPPWMSTPSFRRLERMRRSTGTGCSKRSGREGSRTVTSRGISTWRYVALPPLLLQPSLEEGFPFTF